MPVIWWGLFGCLVWAALMDLIDHLGGHRRRSISQMIRVRGDMRADSWSTQHRGVSIPVDGVIADRGTPGARPSSRYAALRKDPLRR